MLEPHGQKRAQHASAIHRKGRQEIESHEHDVDGEKLGQQIAPALRHGLQFSEIKEASDHDIERKGNDDIDRRTGQRDDQFLPRFVRHAFQPRHATDGEERDIRRVDPVSAGGKGVAELVEDDADKEQDNEGKAGKHRRRSTFRVVDKPEPGEEEEKGRVDADVDAGNPCEVE